MTSLRENFSLFVRYSACLQYVVGCCLCLSCLFVCLYCFGTFFTFRHCSPLTLTSYTGFELLNFEILDGGYVPHDIYISPRAKQYHEECWVERRFDIVSRISLLTDYLVAIQSRTCNDSFQLEVVVVASTLNYT